MNLMERIYWELGRNHRVKLVGKENDLQIVNWERPPSNYEQIQVAGYQGALLMEISRVLKVHGKCFLEVLDGKVIVHRPPVVNIFLNKIRFSRYDERGTPILLIDDKEYSGYKDVSMKIYGVVRNKAFMLDLMSKFQKDVDYQNPRIEDLEMVKIQKSYGKKPYPIIALGSKQFNGMSSLIKEYPQFLKHYTEILQHIGYLKAPNKNRAEQLIEIFDLCQFKKTGNFGFVDPETKEDMFVKTQKELAQLIKNHPQGKTLSQETQKRLFELLKEE